MSMEAVKEKVGYAQYQSYRESGVAIIGRIPKDWSVLRLKYGATINDDALNGSEDPDMEIQYVDISSVEFGRGIVAKEIMRFGDSPSRARRLVRDGDVIVSTVRTYLKAIAPIVRPDRNLVVSTGFAVLRPSTYRPEFLRYVLESELFLCEVAKRSVGVSYPGINASQLGDIFGVLPSLPEQIRIAAFLDRKCGQIDRAIAQKEQLIALLKERRQVLVQQAVTKGLDPKVKMKDSGVPWLGMIPAHWEVKTSKRLFGQRKERAQKGDQQLTASQKHGVIPQQLFMELEGRRVTQVMLNADILKHVEANDFVISMRSFQGGIEHSAYSGCISSAYIPLVPLRYVVTDFFRYLLKCPSYITALAGTSDLVRDGQAMRYENFCAIDLVIVPEVEQTRIASYLKGMDERTDKALSIHEAQIAKLKEYRSILINAAVTGQIKV